MKCHLCTIHALAHENTEEVFIERWSITRIKYRTFIRFK